MATLFLSYQHDDEPLARGLELRLKGMGHTFKIPVATKILGDWRSKLLKALAESDAVIILLSENGLSSPYVLGQVGSVRALALTKPQLMLPIVVDDVEIPKFVSDVTCFELRTRAERELDRLAEELGHAVEDHARQVPKAPKAPRIFVSHRHKDEPVAAALVSVLEAAFHVDKTDIRCTSVQPYALPPGERISERLKTDVNGAELVIGVIGPETAESRYVLFELGASWGRDAPTFPVLVRGATNDDVPGPLGEQNAISLKTTANCLQLVDDIADGTTLRRRQGVTGRVAAEAETLAKVAGKAEKKKGPVPSDETDAGPTSDTLTPAEERMAQHITNYLKEKDFSMVSFDRIRENINSKYTDKALLNLIDRAPDKFRRARLKGGRPGIGRISD